MLGYSQIDPIKEELRHGNSGEAGWGCTFWSYLNDSEAPHRASLENFAQRNSDARLILPAWIKDEDYVDGIVEWQGRRIEVYYETILSYLSIWSVNRYAVEMLREALIESR